MVLPFLLKFYVKTYIIDISEMFTTPINVSSFYVNNIVFQSS